MLQERSYWDERFVTENEYDWFGDYAMFRGELAPHIPSKQARILVLGCGTSTLSADLYRDGFLDVTSTDYSPVVIEKMQQRHPELKWRVMDATQTFDFPCGHFDVVIEKGLVDVFMDGVKDQWHLEASKRAQMAAVCSEVARVMRPRGAVFLSITFSPPHFRKQLYARSRFGWSVNARRCEGASAGAIEYYVYRMRRGEPLSEADAALERGHDEHERGGADAAAVLVELEENDILNIDID